MNMKNDGNGGKYGKHDGNGPLPEAHGSHFSRQSHRPADRERLLPPRGDYQTLLSYQKAR